MDKDVIGINAGKVWQALNNRRLTWDELLRVTALTDQDLDLALGWLAREDKISFVNIGNETLFEVYEEKYY